MAEDSKAIKSILNDLEASNEQTVLDTIKRNRKEGNNKTFAALLKTLKNTDEPSVEAAIIEFLYDLKDQGSVDVLVEALNKNEMPFYDSFLIAAFWQSTIDGSEHLPLFVKKAIEGDYMVCLEALTVVENFDSRFNNETIIELEADIDEAIEAEKGKDKVNLLISLRKALSTLPREGEE
jgi:hypothetical protein